MRDVALREHLERRLPVALEWLRRMVEINSWTGNRAGVNRLGELTAECFASLGFTAERMPSVNPAWGDHVVLTRMGKGSHSLALVSHLDTVFPPEEEERNAFRWSVEGDRIYGPGTNDIKGGTVMIWLVLDALRETAPDVFESVTWRLLFNSSEEDYSPDFGALCRQHFDQNALAALIFEAEGRLGEQRLLVTARKGRATWRLTAEGRGAHAGAAHRYGANAIVQLSDTVQRLAALTDPAQDLTVNVALVRGGTVLNRVPHEAVVEGELRAFKPEVFERAKAAVLNLSGTGSVRSVADRYPCTVKAEILTESRPWPRNAATDNLLKHWLAAGEELGLSVGGHERGGLSDGNLIWDAVPTLDGLGPWGDFSHCSERSADGAKMPEYVEISSFLPKAALNVRAIQRLLGHGDL